MNKNFMWNLMSIPENCFSWFVLLNIVSHKFCVIPSATPCKSLLSRQSCYHLTCTYYTSIVTVNGSRVQKEGRCILSFRDFPGLTLTDLYSPIITNSISTTYKSNCIHIHIRVHDTNIISCDTLLQVTFSFEQFWIWASMTYIFPENGNCVNIIRSRTQSFSSVINNVENLLIKRYRIFPSDTFMFHLILLLIQYPQTIVKF